MTLAQLKRDLCKGKSLALVDAPTMPNHKNLNVKRYVVATQGNGVTLSPDVNAPRGSFMELPKASLVEYDGKTVKIYQGGKRLLTEEEQQVIDTMPSHQEANRELAERDIMTDGSTTYWMDKRHTKEHQADWYWETSRGLRYDFNDKMMWDDSVKGQLELVYKLG